MKNVLICLLSIIWLTGCSTVAVNFEVNESADFAQLKHYAWVEEESGDKVRVTKPQVGRNVVSSVDRHLSRKGYVLTEKSEADFLVSWFGRVKDKVAQNNIDHFYNTYGYGALAATQPEMVAEGGGSRNFSKGTLIIDLLDAKTKKVIWRGTATDTIVADMSEGDVAAYIERSVRQVLSGFPPE